MNKFYFSDISKDIQDLLGEDDLEQSDLCFLFLSSTVLFANFTKSSHIFLNVSLFVVEC